MKQHVHALEIIMAGPATSEDVGAQMFGEDDPRSTAKASSSLSRLRDMGLVRVIGRIRGGRCRLSNVWEAVG